MMSPPVKFVDKIGFLTHTLIRKRQEIDNLTYRDLDI